VSVSATSLTALAADGFDAIITDPTNVAYQ
jgi:hypothetical protein